jgi:hypothetical protein
MTREEIRKSLNVIEIDVNGQDVPPSVKDLQPLIFKDGDSVCVMQGESPMDGIFGWGKTTKEAMEDFQRN